MTSAERVREILALAELAKYADMASEPSGEEIDDDSEFAGPLLRGWNDALFDGREAFKNPKGVTPPAGANRYTCMAASGRLRQVPASVIVDICNGFLREQDTKRQLSFLVGECVRALDLVTAKAVLSGTTIAGSAALIQAAGAAIGIVRDAVNKITSGRANGTAV